MPHPGSPADRPLRLLAELGITPRKRLGQNFLHDRNIARKIVSIARELGPPFLEIGAGLGALTSLLAAGGEETVAVEVDRTLSRFLRERVAGSRVEILEADFLSVRAAEWKRRFRRGGSVVGNLPYSISSPIVLRLMELRSIFPRAVLMLQKEMAERLCASPGGKEYGILSVYLSVLSESRIEFPVRRTCFVPAPEVDSAVLSVRFRSDVDDPTYLALQRVVRAAFARRRKQLRNAPAGFLRGGTSRWCDLLSRSGIDPSRRAESVPPATWLALARSLLHDREPG